MNNFLNCKKIETAISRCKKSLIKIPVYENFGQTEIRKIEEKFIDISDYSKKENLKRKKLNDFNNWCMNYTG